MLDDITRLPIKVPMRSFLGGQKVPSYNGAKSLLAFTLASTDTKT